MAYISIPVKSNSPVEQAIMANALQEIAANFSKENIQYIAELSRKPNVNDKFNSLKKNPLIKSLL